MSAIELVSRVQAVLASGKPLDGPDTVRLRDEIHHEFKVARTDEDRVTLLKLHKAIMDAWERALEREQIPPEQLDKFRTTRLHDYRLLIVSETVDQEGLVLPDTLCRVTKREVDSGRMSPKDELRELALKGPSSSPKTNWMRRLWVKISGQ